MCEVTARLKQYVDKHGLLATAILLEHNDTVTLKRWLDKGIPAIQKAGLKALLEQQES